MARLTQLEAEQLKQLQAECEAELRIPGGSAEARARLENAKAAIAGRLMSVWLPLDWPRRLIMLSLLIVGAYGLLPASNHYLLLTWVLMATMSPKLVGISVFWLGWLTGVLQRRP